MKLGKHLPVRAQLYCLVFFFGIVIGLLGTAASVLLKSSPAAIAIAAGSSVLFAILWTIAVRKPEHSRNSVMFALFYASFFAIPALYITGGSIYSGVSVFFVLGIALDLFIMEKRQGQIAAAVLSFWYIAVVALSVKFSSVLPEIPAVKTESLRFFSYISIGVTTLLTAILTGTLARIVFAMFRQSSHTLETSIAEMTRRSEIDPLTGLYNRRQLFAQLHDEINYAQETNEPLSVILFDIDDFKDVNDKFSHPVGDTVIHNVADILMEARSKSDSAARYGGEEFLMILPGRTLEEALELADDIRIKISSSKLAPEIPKSSPVTVSAGAAQFSENMTERDLVNAADSKMYLAKSNGKNRVAG